MKSRWQETWPELPWPAWSGTCATLQLWTQVIGKIRMQLVPHLNHAWNVTLYPTIRGLTTDPMPYGPEMLQIDFDFVEHCLLLEACGRRRCVVSLAPMTVAAFYREVMRQLDELGMPVKVWTMPAEVADPIPLDKDEVHREYDPEYAQRFWRVLLQTTRVFTTFRARFRGKVSPIHLFWGAMDLACTRFSGREAPEHPSMPGLPDRVTRDAYSHEVSSAGFWPGGPGMDAMLYSYAYPEPSGYRQYRIAPASASFNQAFGEFILPYEAMRNSPDPDAALLEFLQTTYDAAADCGKWNRAALDVR
jgi:hypothetical protein